MTMQFELDQFTLSGVSDPVAPILISTPHDGLLSEQIRLPVPHRINGVLLRDTGTWSIVLNISTAVDVNIVRGLLPRTYVDYNRAPEEAFEQKIVEAAYRTYHQKIHSTLEQMKQSFACEKILLVDIHGFANQPPYCPEEGYDIILGTGNRETVFGDVDRELAYFLRSRGYRVFLPEKTSVRVQDDMFNGGYTVRHYSRAHQVSCVQIEIAKHLRGSSNEVGSTSLALNLADFLHAQ